MLCYRSILPSNPDQISIILNTRGRSLFIIDLKNLDIIKQYTFISMYLFPIKIKAINVVILYHHKTNCLIFHNNKYKIVV